SAFGHRWFLKLLLGTVSGARCNDVSGIVIRTDLTREDTVGGCVTPMANILPARLAGLPRVAAIIVPAAASPKPLPTASGPVRLGLGFVHFHRSPTKITAVQRRNRFIGFGSVGHFHETEAAGATGVTIRHKTHSFDGAVLLKNTPQFCFCCAVGKVAYVKILHCISSLCNSPAISIFPMTPLGSLSAESRRGRGLSRNARERASASERTAEIRRHASMIPQYFGTPGDSRIGKEAATSGNTVVSDTCSEAGVWPFGEAARYLGLPTRKAIACEGVAARISSQNLYICGSSVST